MAHGKCLKGNHLLVWEPPPRVSDAYCPQHDFPLVLAPLRARSLQSDAPVQQRPRVGPRHTTKGTVLKTKLQEERRELHDFGSRHIGDKG